VLRIRIRDPCFFDPWIRNRFFPDSWKIGPNFFLQHIKNEIIFNFVKFVATKKGNTFFSPLSFVAVFGSGIRDTGWVKIGIGDPGWVKIRIRNPG
jgi:hypothetical protein